MGTQCPALPEFYQEKLQVQSCSVGLNGSKTPTLDITFSSGRSDHQPQE